MFVDPNTTDLEFYEDAMNYVVAFGITGIINFRLTALQTYLVQRATFRMTQTLEHLFPTSVFSQEAGWHDRHSSMDMPPAEATKKAKEFRYPPKEQMFRLLMCRVKEKEIQNHSRKKMQMLISVQWRKVFNNN
ncbi:unnamed protein product [Caenorhabditis nigoni]|uniref:Uncharacterized protein n=1 Tax=Caenorhabditis nigoni TaxID=1611254 RepID=A0A2G5SEY0_9PELO|nr:hypothetical protein B9Z55_027718 [Caenorhabditis nigoni]